MPTIDDFKRIAAGTQDAVEASPFPAKPIEGFRAFMEFVRSKIKK